MNEWMNYYSSYEDIPVYNYVSGNQNPITWGRFFKTCTIFGIYYPTSKAIYANAVILVKSKLIYALLVMFLEIIPSLIIDRIGKLFGKDIGWDSKHSFRRFHNVFSSIFKRYRLYKVVRKIGDTLYTVGYFSTQQWDFKDYKIQNLWKRIEPEDKQTFPFDVQSIDWDEYFMKMVKGLRRFIFLDPERNERESRRRRF